MAARTHSTSSSYPVSGRSMAWDSIPSRASRSITRIQHHPARWAAWTSSTVEARDPLIDTRWALPIDVVAGVFHPQPPRQRLMGTGTAPGRDRVDVRHVCGELYEHAVRVLGVQRPSVAVLEHVGAVGLPTGRRQAVVDLLSQLGCHLEGDVTER